MNDHLVRDVETALRDFKDPYAGCNLYDAQAVKSLSVDDGRVSVVIELGFPAERYATELREALSERLMAIDGVIDIAMEIDWSVKPYAVQHGLKPMQGIKNIIAIASGKGGVGKSTTAVNLALALATEGAAVGLLDADIYGPSQPRMLGLMGQRPASVDGRTLEPLQAHGIRAMSIGFLVDEEQPMVWRGPMVTQALNQLMNDTHWGDLDYLIVDMPPGTGDTQLTMSQQVPLAGAVIVTTPQDIALLDARKGLKMFEKVNVSVLGIIENMSTHVCSNCGHEEPIFGEGGGAAMAEQYDVPLLGSLPLDIRIRSQADSGKPSVIADMDGEPAMRYLEIARRISAGLAAGSRDYSHLFPKITVEES